MFGTACRWRLPSTWSTPSTRNSRRRRASEAGHSPSCRPPGHHWRPPCGWPSGLPSGISRFLVMPYFGSSPIEALPTIAVTFWYAWLFNHASGSALLTLIAHATNGTIETSTLWQAGADATRMTWLYSLVWCLVAIGLLVFNRRFWTQPPAPVDDPIVLPPASDQRDGKGRI